MIRPTTRVLLSMPLLLVVAAGCRARSAPSSPRVPATTTSGIRFEDVTSAAGLQFRHSTGADGRYLLPESLGNGGAFLDFDHDGLLDVFLVNGAGWPDRPATRTYPALYRNTGRGKFVNVTAQAGLNVSMQGMGCAVGDFDNDGHDDLLVTCLGPNHLFRNLGTGRFQDVTAGTPLAKAPRWSWHTSAAWTDYDRDGLLDLFICRYVAWSPKEDVPCRSKSGRRTYCGPEFYPGDRPVLYRNLGHGRFEDVSARTGIGAVAGKGLGVLPVDEDGDGWTDLVVANDLVPNFLFRNEQGKRFREVGQEAGLAVGDSGQARAGMGIDLADTQNNGTLSVAIGNFANEGLALFTQDGSLYQDQAAAAGLLPASLSRLTFGLLFLDADQDGWPDLFAYNGHVDPLVAEENSALTYPQNPSLFRNVQGHFEDVSASAGPAFQQPQVGRGCAWGDFDNDGRPDLLLCENAGPARLLRNVTPAGAHWLGVRLVGRGGNRNGYGAEIKLVSAGTTQRRWVRSGGSYLSHSDSRALFGLGDGGALERLEVKWPSGKITLQKAPAVDQYLEIREP